MRFSWLYLILLMLVAVYVGAREDYRAFFAQWTLFLSGGDPWLDHAKDWQKNAYGPLFNLLAYPFAVYAFWPKWIFILIWFFCSKWLFEISGKSKNLIWLLIFNPFFAVELGFYGHFDIVVAAFCLFSIHFYCQKRDFLSGALLALSVGFKFYPLVTFPFLVFDQKGWRPQFVVGFLGTLFFIFFISWLYWGSSVFEPLLFASDRESRLMSIFHYLRERYSFLHLFWEKPNLDSLAHPLLAFFGLFTFGVHLKKRMRPELAFLSALIVTFLFYKVGHHQFQVVFFFIVAYWMTRVQKPFSPVLRVWQIYLIFLSCYAVAYFSTNSFQRDYTWMRFLIAVPSFAFGVWAWMASLKVNLDLRR